MIPNPSMRSRARILAVATVAAAFASVLTGQAAGAATPPVVKDTPFVRMFTQVDNPNDAAAVNKLSGTALDAKLAELTRWYVHFHSQAANAFPFGDVSKAGSATTLAEKLSARGAMVSNYRNGSYVSQATSGQLNFAEAADLEAKAPLAISTYWPGNPAAGRGSLTSTAARTPTSVSSTQRTVTVRSAAAMRPAGAAVIWPFAPSRGTGAASGSLVSANTHDFVSWVRVDDEIMRVVGVSGDAATVTLTVDRGYFGTTAASHAAEARVFAPVYIGSGSSASGDSDLAGTPKTDRTDRALRYGIKIWQGAGDARKDGVGWIAGRIKTTFGAGRPGPYLQGYNTVWLDVTSCTPYNNADGTGQAVTPWSDPHAGLADSSRYKGHQVTKISGLRGRFGASTGYPALKFIANNVASQGVSTTACRNELLASGLDGGVLENWLKDPALWSVQMDQSFQIQANDWPAMYWVRTNSPPPGSTADKYKRFAYGSYLLSRRDGSTRAQFGMPSGLADPGELFRWDLGTSIDKPTSVASLRTQSCGGASVYRRDFTKGTVLVNTSGATATCTLAAPAYDVVNKTGGQPTLRTTVTVPARDAALLLTS